MRLVLLIMLAALVVPAALLAAPREPPPEPPSVVVPVPTPSPLLAFCLQAVDQQCKVQTPTLGAKFFRIGYQCFQLIFEYQLSVIK